MEVFYVDQVGGFLLEESDVGLQTWMPCCLNLPLSEGFIEQ